MNPFVHMDENSASFLFRYKELFDESASRIVAIVISGNDDWAALLGAEIADRDVMSFNLGRKYEEELHSS